MKRTRQCRIAIALLSTFLLSGSLGAEQQATGLTSRHSQGQTFLTWKDLYHGTEV